MKASISFRDKMPHRHIRPPHVPRWSIADTLSYFGMQYIKQDDDNKTEWSEFVKKCVKNYDGGIGITHAIIGIMKELSELPKEHPIQITSRIADRYDFLDVGQGDLVTRTVVHFHKRGEEFLHASNDFNSEAKELAIVAKMRHSSREVFSGVFRFDSEDNLFSDETLEPDNKDLRLERLRKEQ